MPLANAKRAQAATELIAIKKGQVMTQYSKLIGHSRWLEMKINGGSVNEN